VNKYVVCPYSVAWLLSARERGESIGLIKPRDWLVNLLGVKPRGTRLVYL